MHVCHFVTGSLCSIFLLCVVKNLLKARINLGQVSPNVLSVQFQAQKEISEWQNHHTHIICGTMTQILYHAYVWDPHKVLSREIYVVLKCCGHSEGVLHF
jgi:hypothetical protein